MNQRHRFKAAVFATLIVALFIFAAFQRSASSKEEKGEIQIVGSSEARNVGSFLLSNPTPFKANVMLQAVEIFSNGKWQLDSNFISPQSFLVIGGNSIHEMDVDKPTGAEQWRVRFTCVEKNTRLSGMLFRIGWFFKQKNVGLPERWNTLIHGEVYHDFELVSDAMSKTNRFLAQ
jgi:hypothetical protein